MLLCGFESWLGLESSGFSMWHFLKLVARGFLRVLRFSPLLHRFNGSANKIKIFCCITSDNAIFKSNRTKGAATESGSFINIADYEFKVDESEMCPCDADIMTAEHLLQHCQLHGALRWDMWPEPKPLRDKLYGNLEELQRTAAFVRATGISI